MDVVKVTKELVDINSENTLKHEIDIAKFINEHLTGMGIESKVIRYGGGRANVVASMGKGDGLMLNGHLDTVPIGDPDKWPSIGAYEKNGKIYGRGASDMKGGIASIVSAISLIKPSRIKKRILLTFVSDEEGFSTGSLFLLKNRKELFKGIKYGIVAEPTDMKIQVAQKGAVAIEAQIIGKSAHGSVPWEGNNAISGAAKLIVALDSSARMLRKTRTFGTSSMNIGTIKGGTMGNVVPDRCVLEIDRRILPGESGRSAADQINKIIKTNGINARTRITFEAPPYSVSKSSPIAKLVKKATACEFSVSSGYTEAELYHRFAGIDSVVFGPGSKREAHKYNECVSIASLRKTTSYLNRILNSFCS